MRTKRIMTMVGCGFLAVSAFVWAQTRKAGLWEVTSNMTWQQSPMPAGMPAGAAGANSPFAGGTKVTKVCLTQEQIDKYGGIMPETRSGCQVTDIVKKPGSMSAAMVCEGRITGKGTVESSWTDEDHAKGKVHFTGSVQAG